MMRTTSRMGQAFTVLRDGARFLDGAVVLHLEPDLPARLAETNAALPVLLNKWYFDELYDVSLSAQPWHRPLPLEAR